MLKKLVVVAGALLSAAVVSGAPAEAAPHHVLRSHRAAIAIPRIGHRRWAGRRRPATALGGPRLRAGHRAFAHAGSRFGRGRHYANHLGARRTRTAALGRDAAIRDYVGPRASYAPAGTPTGGGVQVGSASFYSGRRTASGGAVGAATCAHRTLPFGTRVLVTNLVNGAKTVLTVNDRGPFVRGRILDVSRGAAGMLGMVHAGTARIAMQVLGRGNAL